MRNAYADQVVLARNMACVYDLSCHAPGTAGRRETRYMRTGHCAVFAHSRDGVVLVSRDPAQYHVGPWEMDFVRLGTQSAYDDRRLLGGDLAGLSCGFRSVLFPLPRSRDSAHAMLRNRFICAPDGRHVRPECFSVPHAPLGRHGAAGSTVEIMSGVQVEEDYLCLSLLSLLPWHRAGLECAGRPTVDGLIGRLEKMNASRPPNMRLDTMFVSLQNFRHMAAGRQDAEEGRTAYGNVLQFGHCIIVGHEGISDDTAYFTSFSHGPALVRGPTVIRHVGDRVYVEHYCEMQPARMGAAPGIPGGYAVRLAPAPTGDAPQGARETAALGDPADQFLAVALSLSKSGEHGLARAVLEKAPRGSRTGAMACVVRERVLGYLGVNGDDLIASHNDLLASMNDLVGSGVAGDELLDARARVMRRLGLA